MNAPAFTDDAQAYTAVQDMLAEGYLQAVDDDSVEAFMQDPRPHLLFFTGPHAVRREAHDVAVALRELLKDYRDTIDGALVDDTAGKTLSKRFRADATPCLVLLNGREILEVIPRVRDWADYAAAFRRYLGDAPGARSTGVSS